MCVLSVVFSVCTEEDSSATSGTRHSVPVQALERVQQVWVGLQFLHRHTVLKGSVKPANVFLHGTCGTTAVLGDLGSACRFPAQGFAGTPGYVLRLNIGALFSFRLMLVI